jgi:hypothetical protein
MEVRSGSRLTLTSIAEHDIVRDRGRMRSNVSREEEQYCCDRTDNFLEERTLLAVYPIAYYLIIADMPLPRADIVDGANTSAVKDASLFFVGHLRYTAQSAHSGRTEDSPCKYRGWGLYSDRERFIFVLCCASVLRCQAGSFFLLSQNHLRRSSPR